MINQFFLRNARVALSILVVFGILAFTGHVFGATVFTSGIPDNYDPSSPSPEQPNPSQGLQTWISNNYYYPQIRDYDDCIRDRYFGHTFSGLGNHIISATLEIGVASNHDNDSVGICFVDQNGVRDNNNIWYINIQSLTGNSIPFCPLPPSQNISPLVLDLANLPVGGGITDLISTLNAKG
ncbi:MAG: hypothetical protein GY795_45800 [Desulfobacterales bacterium]|nr:hypothetical protein [Desulfobacterales bacterium]